MILTGKKVLSLLYVKEVLGIEQACDATCKRFRKKSRFILTSNV